MAPHTDFLWKAIQNKDGTIGLGITPGMWVLLGNPGGEHWVSDDKSGGVGQWSMADGPPPAVYDAYESPNQDGPWTLVGQVEVPVSLDLVAGKADDTSVVHLASSETVTGKKSFAADTTFASGRPRVDITDPAFGADPTGTLDSTAAIQKALNAAGTLSALLQTQVEVFASYGVFTITAPASGTGNVFTVPNDVDVEGLGKGSIFRIAAGSAGYSAIFYALNPRRVRIHRIRIDQNAANHKVPVNTANAQQWAIKFQGGQHIRVDDVDFDVCTGVNTVQINGSGPDDNEVTNCRFNFVMRDASIQGDFDNTCVYVTGTNKTYANNKFTTTFVQGRGARTAMEAIGGAATVTGNKSDWFRTLLMCCSDNNVTTGPTGGITAVGNVADHANYGITVWPNGSGSAELHDVLIGHNVVRLSQATHNLPYCCGIKVINDAAAVMPLRNLTIDANVVHFLEDDGTRTFPSPAQSADTMGIGARTNGAIHGMKISHNTVVGAPAYGILLEALSAAWSDIDVKHNLVIDPGMNTGPSVTAAQRTGIQLRGPAAMAGGSIDSNRIHDTQNPARAVNGIAVGAGTYTGIKASGNQTMSDYGALVNSLTNLGQPVVAASSGSSNTNAKLVGGATSGDAAGTVQWTTPAAPVAGNQVDITFSTPFGTPPVVIVGWGGAGAPQSAPGQLAARSITATGFSIYCPAGLPASTTVEAQWIAMATS